MQVSTQAQEQLELANEIRQGFGHINARLDSFDQRLTQVEQGGARHAYTQAQAEGPRGVEAPVDDLFGFEPEMSSSRTARTVSSGESAVCEKLFQSLSLRERTNKQNKRTGRKLLLFVTGPLTQDKQRTDGPSMYWDIRRSLESGLLNGAKLTTDEVSVFEQIMAICHQVNDGETDLPAVATYEGATQKVKAFLKRNR